jgi:hypothetical protein
MSTKIEAAANTKRALLFLWLQLICGGDHLHGFCRDVWARTALSPDASPEAAMGFASSQSSALRAQITAQTIFLNPRIIPDQINPCHAHLSRELSLTRSARSHAARQKPIP